MPKTEAATSRPAVDPKLRRRVRELLKRDIERVEYPGGEDRDSMRLFLRGGSSVIATTRASLESAMLEKSVLRALSARRLPSPRLLGAKRHTLLQEDVGGERLSQALRGADADVAQQLLGSALDGLARIQRAASEAGLDEEAPARGHDEDWLVGLLRQPRMIGERIGVDPPRLEKSALLKLLAVRRPRFVKWDARPGNALVDPSGRVVWIDWEHAGTRNRLDDVAWLLADEYVADDADVESALVDTHIDSFSDGLSRETALDYLFTYGAYHSSVRLGYILRYYLRKHEWWDIDQCLRDDKVGVTLECAQTVCRRAGRWAAQSSVAAPLAPWFRAVEAHLATP